MQIFISKNNILVNKKLNIPVEKNWFDPNFWHNQYNLHIENSNEYHIKINKNIWILKQYRRKDFMQNIISDKFIYINPAYTKSFLELQMLEFTEKLSLPTPKAIAAHYHKQGLMYSSSILIEKIPNAKSLLLWLQKNSIEIIIWKKIGITIAKFHSYGIDNKKLSIKNILFDGENIYFANFESCIKRIYKGRWQSNNLIRLQQSFIIAAQTYGLKIQRMDLNIMLEAYNSYIKKLNKIKTS